MSPVKTSLVDAMTGEVIIVPPTDLYSDEPPLETDWHREQVELLLACLKAWWRERSDFYASGNLTIYFNEDQIKSRDFRGPDFFVVLGTDPHPRKSWVLWGEDGKYPNVIVEMLSASTATIDRTTKKQLYQDTFRTPEYFWFHPETLEFQGFCLTSGEYQPIEPNEQGWLISHQLNLYLGVFEQKLRFFTLEGELVPSPQEIAARAEEKAAQAEERASKAVGGEAAIAGR
ncbi:Uma2 family endonuclease [Phormidesmis sp. 146-12]